MSVSVPRLGCVRVCVLFHCCMSAFCRVYVRVSVFLALCATVCVCVWVVSLSVRLLFLCLCVWRVSVYVCVCVSMCSVSGLYLCLCVHVCRVDLALCLCFCRLFAVCSVMDEEVVRQSFKALKPMCVGLSDLHTSERMCVCSVFQKVRTID